MLCRYDEQDRLTWAGTSGTPPCSTGAISGTTITNAEYTTTYGYDTLDRLTSGASGSYTYGDSAHLHAATAIGTNYSASYDAAGNMTCRAPTSSATCSGISPTGAQLGYDSEGRLVSWQNAPTNPTTTAAYLYDGEGERVESQVTQNGTATTTVYVGSLEDVATSGGSATTTTYYPLVRAGFAVSINGGALSYVATDHLGSPSVTLDGSGNLTGSQLYAAYGTSAYTSGTMPGSYGYTGQHSDVATTGLDYYGERSYDPLAGQFTTADAARDGPSPYAYVAGNPETLVDPSGAVACSGSSCQTESGAVDPLAEGELVGTRGQSDPVWLANLFLYQRSLWLMGEAYAEGVQSSLQTLTGAGALQIRQATDNAYWNSSDAAMQTYGELNLPIDWLAAASTGKTDDMQAGGEASNTRVGANDGSGDEGLMGDGLTWGETATTEEALGGDELAARNDEALRDPEARAGGDGAGGGGACSFSAETPVATPTGEQAIGTLQVGEQVTAYDPSSGQTSTQMVQHVWVNHDSDLLDVTLARETSRSQTATQDGTGKQQEATLASHGLRAPPTEDEGTGDSSATTTETVHTTANHPWLTADRGWVAAGHLVAGERVLRADGSTATVMGLRVVPGSGTMYNLTVSHLHTYAVGLGHYVAHNSAGCGDTAPTGDNVVYRGLGADENPDAGLTARAPEATGVDPASHVAGKQASPWISTTRDLNTAVTKYGKNGVVAIDLNKVDSPVVDISKGIPGREGQMISNWAARDQEVLIFQRVPPDAIIWRSGPS